MTQSEKKLTKNDLTIGMIVKASQLSEILDTYIVLTDVHLVKDNFGIGTFEGTVDSISNELIRMTKPNSTLVYNDSYDKEGCCEYE
jgi:hypothetical protein